MDRNRELADDYAHMANLVEKFKKRQSLKVEGDWYLVECENEESWVVRLFGDLSQDYLVRKGYTTTPVKIFRES